MALLSVLQVDSFSRARITAALGGEHRIVFSPTWSHLLETVSGRPVEGCILDIYDALEPVPLAALRRFRHRHPELALIVYSDFTGRELDLFQVGRIGANAIILPGRDDSTGGLRGTVAAALAESVATRVGYALRRRIPAGLLRIVRWAVAHAHEDPNVSDVSRAFGVGQATLNRHLREAGLPTAGPLLVWGKLFRAAPRLADGECTVESVAYQLGYSSGTAFRRALKRCTGATPTEVGAGGGLDFVVERFRERALDGTSPPETPWPPEPDVPRVLTDPFRRDEGTRP